MKTRIFIIAVLTAFFLQPIVYAEIEGPHVTGYDMDKPKAQMEYSPHINQSFPKEVFWGDTHLHTTYSPDAGMVGNFNLGPADAYRFARGEQVRANNGMQAKLVRPLDFLAVTDHSEYMGLIPLLRCGDPEILSQKVGRRWYEMFNKGPDGQYDVLLEFAASINDNTPVIESDKIIRATWEMMAETADEYNDPGKFTAFIGYEWTSMPGGDNLHRCVIFRDGANKVKQIMPFSSFDSEDPEDLWKFLANYEDKTFGRVMAIPHNPNVSGGLMYDTKTLKGKKLTKAYAEMRARFEHVLEITQMKGDSETHPKLSPDDEFADFEQWDKVNLTGVTATTDAMLPAMYAREALKTGMKLEKKLGVNPFKQGFIGSTDSHTSLSTAGDDNFFGKLSSLEPGPARWKHYAIKSTTPELSTYGSDTCAAGLAAVWATENTRAGIFDAMERRETYASTGPRITVRVFAGWDFVETDIHLANFAAYGYKHGVPMGGDLAKAPKGKIPNLLIRTLRDPDGANLDRVQVVKGWMDKKGKTHEKVFDVVWSGDRKIDAKGKLPAVGNTVNVAEASYTNTIGEPLFLAHWKDPDFDPAHRAFYYVRVLEIPTPRWTAYDAKRFNVKMAKNVKMQHQERAYTSAIWYTPSL